MSNDKLREALEQLMQYNVCMCEGGDSYDPLMADYHVQRACEILTEALAASKPEPKWRTPGGIPRYKPEPQAEPCPNHTLGEHACKNRHQCWSPCGELGKSKALAASKPEPQAQAAEPSAVQFHDHPDFVGGIKWSEIELKWIEARDRKWREAIAKKDAALKACVEVLRTYDLIDTQAAAAITKAQEAME